MLHFFSCFFLNTLAPPLPLFLSFIGSSWQLTAANDNPFYPSFSANFWHLVAARITDPLATIFPLLISLKKNK